jgi:hypothetical protein
MKQGSLLIMAGLLLAGGALHADEERSLERLRVNHAAMVSSEQDFHDRQRRGTLSGVEASDYAAYVARLHRLVAEDCAELALAGVSLPSELGCPRLTPNLLVPPPIDQATEQTPDEQLAALDAELMGGLGDFDEMLLREQDRVRAKAPMSDAGGAGGGGAGSGDGSGEGSGEGDAGAAGGAEGESAESGEGTEASQGTGGANAGMGGRESGPRAQRDGRKRGAPGNIPNGDDDDVVARQLREAAEKETSPELKAKLWEEYRKYKEGTS